MDEMETLFTSSILSFLFISIFYLPSIPQARDGRATGRDLNPFNAARRPSDNGTALVGPLGIGPPFNRVSVTHTYARPKILSNRSKD